MSMPIQQPAGAALVINPLGENAVITNPILLSIIHLIEGLNIIFIAPPD